jgi:hypothetical protein
MPHPKKELTFVVDERELATILAALRYHQAENLQICCDIADKATKDIATNYDSLEPLNCDEVDRLCERINAGSKDSPDRTKKSGY